jgi:hypothetical protein
MKFVDQSFHVPRTPVAVVDCGATGEALLLRALLENMNAVVILHQPGTPEDFLLVLADEDAPQFIVICAHGDDNGIVFGTYAPHIDTSCLVHGRPAGARDCRQREASGTHRGEHRVRDGLERFRARAHGGRRARLYCSRLRAGRDARPAVPASFLLRLARSRGIERGCVPTGARLRRGEHRVPASRPPVTTRRRRKCPAREGAAFLPHCTN